MKRWLTIFFVTAIFFFTGIAFFSSQVTFPLVTQSPQTVGTKFYDYAGITHVHSILSTGSCHFKNIISSASKAHCSFLFFPDLNAQKIPSNIEGYRDDVLVVWAGE